MQRRKRLLAMLAATALICTIHTAVEAQGPGGGPPPGGPGGRPGGPGGRPGGPGGPFGGPGGGRGASVANVPVATLEYALKLTASQKTKIEAIQKEFRQSGFGMPPRPGGNNSTGRPGGGPGGGPGGAPGGGPPDFKQMQAMMQKRLDQEKKAVQRIEAVLTPQQKSALPGALQDIQTLRRVNLPSELLGSLQLTAPQKKTLATLGQKQGDALRSQMDSKMRGGDFNAIRTLVETNRKATREKAMAALTPKQRETASAYLKAHPQPTFGGPGFGPPGGPGGRPGGGPGGFGPGRPPGGGR